MLKAGVTLRFIQRWQWIPEVDFAVLAHGFAPHGRDYILIVEDCLGSNPGQHEIAFTHCVRKRKKPKATPPEKAPTRFHYLYGEIPLLREGGRLRYDPAYHPDLPPGAIRGDIRKQEFCSHCHVPKYFYVDEEKVCVECDCTFTFSAREQKYWYEELRFNFYSHAIRCSRCRRKKRDERVLRNRLNEASRALSESPSEPEMLVQYAQTTYDYYQEFGEGNLDRAIAASREAIRLSPELFEAVYWEAMCQDAAEHFEKARDTYGRFLVTTNRSNRYRALLAHAEQRLRELEELRALRISELEDGREGEVPANNGYT